jgi:hypothetical protein
MIYTNNRREQWAFIAFCIFVEWINNLTWLLLTMTVCFVLAIVFGQLAWPITGSIFLVLAGLTWLIFFLGVKSKASELPWNQLKSED